MTEKDSSLTNESEALGESANLTGWPRLIMEGRRHNLLIHSINIEHWLPQDSWPDISGSVESIFEKRIIPLFSCRSNKSNEITFEALNTIGRKDFTFSVFLMAFNVGLYVPFEISLSAGEETKKNRDSFSKHWKRGSISVDFVDVPKKIICTVKILPNIVLAKPTVINVGLTVLCLEEGLFASSPIISTAKIVSRSAGFLSFDLTGESKVDVSKVGSIVFAYQPIWNPSDLTPGINPCILETISQTGAVSLRLFHDSSNAGQLCLEVCDDGTEDSRFYRGARPHPIQRVFVVSLSWDEERFWLNVDGDLVVSAKEQLRISEADKFFLASRHENEDDGLFAHLVRFQIYDTVIIGQNLRAMLFTMDSELFVRFKDEYKELLAQTKLDSPFGRKPYKGLADHILRAVSTWPSLEKPFRDEAGYRDDCARLLEFSKFINSREALNSTGHTDLFIQIPVDDSIEIGANTRTARIEFKIWPRNDYKEIPEKPIKYMEEREEVGVVVMISHHSQKDIRTDFNNLVTHNEKYPSEGCIEQPFGTHLQHHFIVTHSDPRNGSNKHILYILSTNLLAKEE